MFFFARFNVFLVFRARIVFKVQKAQRVFSEELPGVIWVFKPNPFHILGLGKRQKTMGMGSESTADDDAEEVGTLLQGRTPR